MSAVQLPSPEDVRLLVAEIWSTILGDRFEALDPAEQPISPAIGSTVEITGPWTGRITVDLDRTGADQLARAMFDLPAGELPADDLADAVGELGNIIAGNIKSSLPEPSSLSLPQVRYQPQPPFGCEVSSALTWDRHQVLVSLIELPASETTSVERVGA